MKRVHCPSESCFLEPRFFWKQFWRDLFLYSRQSQSVQESQERYYWQLFKSRVLLWWNRHAIRRASRHALSSFMPSDMRRADEWAPRAYGPPTVIEKWELMVSSEDALDRRMKQLEHDTGNP